MRVIYIFTSLVINFLASNSGAQAQGLANPVKVLRNPAFDKVIATAVRTKDPKYTYADSQEGRYKIVKAKGVEMWFSTYSKSVEVYKYTLPVGLVDAKRALSKTGADFSGGNYAYVSNGDPNSSCYSIQLEPVGATKTQVSYSYECD